LLINLHLLLPMDEKLKESVEAACKLSSNWLNVGLAHQELTDSKLDLVCQHLRTMLKDHLMPKSPRLGPSPGKKKNTSADKQRALWANVDFSGNPITGVGVKKLLALFREFTVALKCLKLYKCHVEDDGGVELAHFLEQQAEPFEELHLSHNRLTHVTLIALLAACKNHAKYPRQAASRGGGKDGGDHHGGHGGDKDNNVNLIPLWARLEYNQIPKVENILNLIKQAYDLNICYATDRDNCGPWRCVNSSKSAVGGGGNGLNKNPCVHLFSINQQRTTGLQETSLEKVAVKKLITRFAPKSCAQSVALMNAPVASSIAPQSTPPVPGSGSSLGTAMTTNATAAPAWVSSPQSTGQQPASSEMKWNTDTDGNGASIYAHGKLAAFPQNDGPSNTGGNAHGKSVNAHGLGGQAVTRGNQPHLERLDYTALHYARDPFSSELQIKCLACMDSIKETNDRKVVIVANCAHTFCSDCFGETVKSNINKSTELLKKTPVAGAGSEREPHVGEMVGKHIPCPCCGVLMKWDDILVLEPDDWQFLRSKLLGGGERRAQSPNGQQESQHIEKTDKKSVDSPPNRLNSDDFGRMIVYPEQVNESTSDALRVETFVCKFCKTVSLQPILTSCSHLFCSPCFDDYVSGQVSAKKARGEQAVAIPCPHPGCGNPLRKADVMDLRDNEAARKGTSAAVTKVIQRVRNNMKVRCVHHPMHYNLDFGDPAREIYEKYNISCDWEGDLNSIEKHSLACQVANLLEYNEPTQEYNEPTQEYNEPTQDDSFSDHEMQKKDIRRAMHEFNAAGAGQLSLKIGNLVELLETSGSGWAAGRVVNPSGEVIDNEIGWFPETFLSSSC